MKKLVLLFSLLFISVGINAQEKGRDIPSRTPSSASKSKPSVSKGSSKSKGSYKPVKNQLNKPVKRTNKPLKKIMDEDDNNFRQSPSKNSSKKNSSAKKSQVKKSQARRPSCSRC